MMNIIYKLAIKLTNDAMYVASFLKVLRQFRHGTTSKVYALCVRIMAAGCVVAIAACGPTQEYTQRFTQEDADIIIYGDSMMAWNARSAQAVPDALANLLDRPVENRAINGARISHIKNANLDIRKQHREGDGPVIIVNGGANDMFFECFCFVCDGAMKRIISPDGQRGELPDFLRSLSDQGSQVIFMGYHRSRGLTGPAKNCKNELDELDVRADKLAQSHPNIDFVPLQDVFPVGDPSYYAFDRLHPSAKGSAAIAQRLAVPVKRALMMASKTPRIDKDAQNIQVSGL